MKSKIHEHTTKKTTLGVRRTIKFLSIALILIVGMILTFQGCQKDFENELTNSNIEKHHVSIDEIKKIVNNPNFKEFKDKFQNNNVYYKSNSTSDSLIIIDYKEIKDSTATTSLYLTKLSDNSIVTFAADDRSHPIMSISDEKINLNIDSIPPAYISWLYDEADAIKFAKDNNLEQTIEISNEWQTLRIPPDDDSNEPWYCPNAYFYEKSPLLSTNWGQGVGYNNLVSDGNLNCTNYSNGQAPTGCVATAMAQIMKYYQHPTNYNWSNMPNFCGTVDTQILMRDIGNAVDMDYDCNGSGASQGSIVMPLMNSFDYQYATFGDYDYQKVRTDLIQNKPVLLIGDRIAGYTWFGTKYKGHAWVADGYRESYECMFDDYGNVIGGWGYLFFHMNWGWGGNSCNYNYNTNSWCGLNNFTAPGGYAYNYHRKMVYRITP